MKLSEMLRKAREAKDLSLQEAADALGASKAYLHDLEKGHQRNPTLRMIASFCLVYGLRAEAIVATALHEDEPKAGDQ